MLYLFRMAAAFLFGTLSAPQAEPVDASAEHAAEEARILLAQAETPPPAAPVAEAPEQEDADDDPAAGVPPSRYVEIAQEHVSSMRASLSKGLDELKQAREKKDAVELTCVNEHVTAMKGILRVSEDAIVALQEAVAGADTERARYEFRKIHVSKRKMDDLLQAAVNCAGADASTSNTSVEMQIDESLATIDPYYGDTSFFFEPENVLVEGDTGEFTDEPPQDIPPASAI